MTQPAPTPPTADQLMTLATAVSTTKKALATATTAVTAARHAWRHATFTSGIDSHPARFARQTPHQAVSGAAPSASSTPSAPIDWNALASSLISALAAEATAQTAYNQAVTADNAARSLLA